MSSSTVTVFLVLGTLFTALIFLGVRRQNSIVETLKSRNAESIVASFGPPVAWETKFNAGHKSHRVIRQRNSSRRASENSPLEAHSDLLLIDFEGHYWHVMVTSVHDQPQQRPFTAALSELRVRRALFNDPSCYELVFGERPRKDQISKLLSGEEVRTATVVPEITP